MSQEFKHVTVMLEPAVQALEIDRSGIYVDGTFGRGGHSRLILSKLNADGRLIAFDRDLAAIQTAQQINDPRFTIVHARFSTMKTYLEEQGLLGKVSGILLDLGVSSPQLDDQSRGFSFMNNGPLDMRMDQTSGLSAREYLYSTSEVELSNVLWTYGEEKNSRLIARKIKELAETQSFEEFLPDTQSLAELIKKCSKKFDKNKNPATRSFQAIRIAVNNELGELESCLADSLALLKPQGRLSIISFHSLEDRVVKNFFREHSTPKPIPKHIPIIDSEVAQDLMLEKTSKAILPSEEEIAQNVRSRSAVLRWAQRSNVEFHN